MEKNKKNKIQWFAAFVDRMKTTSKEPLDPQRFGAHELVRIRTRFQGEGKV